MRIGHYYRTATSEASGVTEALAIWCATAEAGGHSAIVLHQEGKPPLVRYAHSRSVPHIGRGRHIAVPLLWSVLKDIDILVLHEGWVTSNLVAGWLARVRGMPYVVMPHGAYDPEIVKGLRAGRRFRRWLEGNLIRGSAGVHVFFDSELDDVRRIAPCRGLVIPTPFEPCPASWHGKGGYVAWFGRYSIQHKGLDLLMEGLALLDPHERPRLRLHGYDYQGGKERLRGLVEQFDLSKDVDIGARIYGEEKQTYLEGAAAYVHPSRWECHSIALLEALSMGMPVLASSTIHIASSLGEAKAAELVEPTAVAWSSALRKAARLQSYRNSNAGVFLSDQLSPRKISSDYSTALDEALGKDANRGV